MEEAWGKEGGGDLLMVEGEEEDSAAVFLSLAGAATSIIFVATKHLSRQACFCRDKRRVLSQQTRVCRNFCRNKNYTCGSSSQ